MCGIFGYSFLNDTSLNKERRALLGVNLAQLNDKRGGDSWGIVGVKDRKLAIRKGLGHMRDNAYVLVGYPTLMGHTRLKTHGAVNVENAHPFEMGNIVGAHNGVLSNHFELNSKYKRDFAVDSMHLFAHLDAGMDFTDIEGYGAIEWVTKKNARDVFLTKMEGGQLSVFGIGEYEKPVGVVWSSDDDHLKLALKCAGIKTYFEYKVEVGKVYRVTNGILRETHQTLTLKKRTFVDWRRGGSSFLWRDGKWVGGADEWDDDTIIHGYLRSGGSDAKSEKSESEANTSVTTTEEKKEETPLVTSSEEVENLHPGAGSAETEVEESTDPMEIATKAYMDAKEKERRDEVSEQLTLKDRPFAYDEYHRTRYLNGNANVVNVGGKK